MTRHRIAFIGLGAIGLPMAKRLASDPQIELSIFDLRDEALQKAQDLGRVASSIADAIADASVIFSVLPADEHVRSVANEVASSGSPGMVYVDFSTIEPNTIRDIADELGELGIEVLGAALTRSVAAAEVGDLSIFLGGEEATCQHVGALLANVASDVRVVPTAAQAKALKVMNNMTVSATSVMLCEAAVLGSANSVDPRDLVSMFERSHAGSWTLQNQFVKHVLADELSPGRFSTAYMSKDAALAATVARRLGRPAQFAGLVRAAFRGSSALGLEDHYHPAVIRWFEHSALRPHIRFWGAPQTATDLTAANVIAEAVAVQQALLTVDALNLLALEGITPSIALPHLRTGSAENDFIDEILEPSEGSVASISLGVAWERLQLALDLAQRQSIPAWGLEISSHFATDQIAKHGDAVSLRSLVSSIGA